MANERFGGLARLAVGLVGLTLLAPLVGALLLAVAVPTTWSGAAYLSAALLVAGGLLAAGRWGSRALPVALAGLLLAGLVAGARLAGVGRGEGPVRVVVLRERGTEEGRARWINALADEQDLLLFGQALMRLLGGVSRREQAGLAPALRAGYAELRTATGTVVSPVPSTYLFGQGPRAFDAVIVEPHGRAEPEAAVVFLHGFMGNVTLQCWEIAQAARPLGVLTVCPSTGWIGDWWRPGGAATVQTTLDYVRARGIEHIDVGGFSNGGIGLSRLAESVAADDGVEGLFFIAGVTNAEGIAATGLPVLIIAGTRDERMGTSGAAAAAQVIGEAARYVEVEGDHFLIVKEAEAVREALGGWLEER